MTLTLEDRFIVEANRRLRDHEAYRAGMEFVPSPPGATGREMSGYDFTGPDGLKGVYAHVAHKVARELGFES